MDKSKYPNTLYISYYTYTRSSNFDIKIEFVKSSTMKGPSRKELIIDAMSNEEVMGELKEKKLPTFGTGAERKERLKKHYGRQSLQIPLTI